MTDQSLVSSEVFFKKIRNVGFFVWWRGCGAHLTSYKMDSCGKATGAWSWPLTSV